MSKREFYDLLSRCYPLHPLAALALGPLFRKLAQNERSVFSFLESSERHGLRDHLQAGDGRLYCVHHLYDYLLGSIGESLYVQVQGKRWAEISHSRRREMLCGFRRDEVKGDMWDEKLGKVTVIEDGCVTERKVG